MKETQFIKQNQEKWSEFEEFLRSNERDPAKLHDMYIQITDDLSHARTFYPARSVRAYLNGLAQLVSTDFNKRRKTPFSRLGHFFWEELPQVVWESRMAFLWAFIFFCISFTIGWLSSSYDENFVRSILGDSYVDMTIENIKKGDPMAVYKDEGRFDMTMGIMLNNIWVMFLYFLLGIFAGVGSVLYEMFNGVMVGAFLHFFFKNGVGLEANLAVWMHGTLEMSSMIIGTAAGITMGRGLIFPGTYTRLQAFQMSARRAIKLMVAVTLMDVVAAIIEGNLTRHTEAGVGFRAVFIAVNLLFVVVYYIILPYYKYKKGHFEKPIAEHHLPPSNLEQIHFNRIKSSGEIFGDTFSFLSNNSTIYLRLAALLATFFVGFIFFVANITAAGDTPAFAFEFSYLTSFPFLIFNQWLITSQFFMNDNVWFLPIINTVIYTTVTVFIFEKILRGVDENRKIVLNEMIIKVLQIGVLWYVMMWLSNMAFGQAVFFFVLMPFLGLWLYLIYNDGYNIVSAIKHVWWLFMSNGSLSFGVHYTMLLVGYFFFLAINSGFFYIYLQLIGWNFSFLNEKLDTLSVVSMVWVASFLIILIFELSLTAFVFLYYSLLEINEASSLTERLQKIGMSKRIQGMIRE